MNFKELVESAADVLNAKYSYDRAKNVYSVKLIFDDNIDEIVNIYQDVFEEDNESISKKIIVCESLVGKFDNSVNLLLLSESNEDLFFSRAYVSTQNEKILVESCSFMENLDSVALSAIIDEIAQHANYLREELYSQ